ncbi:RelA/SpoT domain-containing protein [Nocardia sp. NPDC050697]|uniref:RelA/SpoT domain-containing protein n=1 Tax=Nocardia sp. NPDC050697 TaxID=3155158 RepID=UPI0033E0CEE8
MNDFIDEFIDRYTREYDFYEQVSRKAANLLRAELKKEGVRCIVSNRAKSADRLEQKCRQRNNKKESGYQNVQEIFDDIVDLAGVRVALYFPGQRELVEGAIRRLFRVHATRFFPEQKRNENPALDSPRFSGYSASHFRAGLQRSTLSDNDKRYAHAKLEIQVASVFMHGWAEVEHDLVYKPQADNLSDEELAALDLLNGLAISAEIALESLQKAGERRVARDERKFSDHFELASHLLGLLDVEDRPIAQAGLGQIDVLFDFITRLNLDTPVALRGYVSAIHMDFEKRPLSEQVADAILKEDKTRYKLYDTVRGGRQSPAEVPSSRNWLGAFLEAWIEFEDLTRDALDRSPRAGKARTSILTGDLLCAYGIIEKKDVKIVNVLRAFRNNIVHGRQSYSHQELDLAVGELQDLTEKVRKRLGETGRKS